MTNKIDQRWWRVGYILLATALLPALCATVVIAAEWMQPGLAVQLLSEADLFSTENPEGWREYPPLSPGPTTTNFQTLQSVEQFGFLTVLAIAAGLTVGRWSRYLNTAALLRTVAVIVALLAIGILAGAKVAGVVAGAIMIVSFVAALRSRPADPPVRYLLLIGFAVFCLGATRYLQVALAIPEDSILPDTMFTTAGWMAFVWIPAVFMTLDLVDNSENPTWVGIQAACIAGLAGVIAVFASMYLGLSGMPIGFADYPDAFANWNFVRSMAIFIVSSELIVFCFFAAVRSATLHRPLPDPQ